jgi:hypothetical protein
MKAQLGVFILLLGTSAAAEFTNETAAQCRKLGEFGRAVAIDRDAGLPKDQVLKRLPTGSTPARRIVELIYSDRSMSPQDAKGLELTCLLNAAPPAAPRGPAL